MSPSVLPILLLLLAIALFVAVGLKQIREHQQGIVSRFGRFYKVVPPGLTLVVPFVDEVRPVDLRTLVIEERIDPAMGTGKVRLWSEVWPAMSLSGETIGPGTPIRIAAIDGQHVVVEPAAVGI